MARIILYVLLFFSLPTLGQPLIKECFDSNGKHAAEDSSEYCVAGKRVLRIDEIHVGTKVLTDTVESYIDTVKAYYVATKSPKFFKIYNKKGHPDGNYIEYHPNRKLKESGKFSNGRRVGKIYSYYPSGKMRSILELLDDPGPGGFSGVTDFKILDYWDSAGNQLVKKGEGACNCFLLSSRREVGKVSNGVRDSVWNEYAGDSLILTETYEYGFLVDGTRYHEGSAYRYKAFERQPEYTGGNEKIMLHLRNNMRYPASARRMGISGVVHVSFIIRKDGAVTDVKVLRGIHTDCDKEAVRVVLLMEKWQPALQRGLPVNSFFNLPIKFKLN